MEKLTRGTETTRVPIIKKFGDRGKRHLQDQTSMTEPAYTGCWQAVRGS